MANEDAYEMVKDVSRDITSAYIAGENLPDMPVDKFVEHYIDVYQQIVPIVTSNLQKFV